MASGINLGNVFDLGAHEFNFYELATIISIYQKEGMKHIRIPTTWMDPVSGSALTDDNGKVNFEHSRFKVLKQVIDFAIERELYVVLNAHHERSFKANYDGSAYYKEKLQTLWTDIAEYFKEYNHYLVFEILNEPEGAFGHWGYRDFTGQRSGAVIYAGSYALRCGSHSSNGWKQPATYGDDCHQCLW